MFGRMTSGSVMRCCINLLTEFLRFSQSLDIETIWEGAGQKETSVNTLPLYFPNDKWSAGVGTARQINQGNR